ncbi:hypothetical protein Vqi01_34210 [Micromonospora qiuiae]|uniref:Uncharacterized protein n=1 Tax=Micromonospora qiuiae TaxID=502268 RepID=A0ABQ4JDL7_9ACTN|nr:hypothetical protein Vqi01_34210 [Micromonospora qiuiae]
MVVDHKPDLSSGDRESFDLTPGQLLLAGAELVEPGLQPLGVSLGASARTAAALAAAPPAG